MLRKIELKESSEHCVNINIAGCTKSRKKYEKNL